MIQRKCKVCDVDITNSSMHKYCDVHRKERDTKYKHDNYVKNIKHYTDYKHEHYLKNKEYISQHNKERYQKKKLEKMKSGDVVSNDQPDSSQGV